jgi:hypothetical protein
VTAGARRLATLAAVLVPGRCPRLAGRLGGALAPAAAEAERLSLLPRRERLGALALALGDGAPPAPHLAAAPPRHALMLRLAREAEGD